MAIKLSRSIFLAGVLTSLNACGSIPSATQPATATPFNAAGSWISPAATQQSLLYVSDAHGSVNIFTYPDGKPAGELKGFSSPAGLCSDSSGNVYVVDTGNFELLEYKHGGTKPIKSLYVMGYFPYGCAVDPSSGDIAVADIASQKQGPGGVSIFQPGQAFPSTYQDAAINAYFFCSYDTNGNVFVDGADYGSYHTLFAELPKGSTNFTAIAIDKTIGFPGAVAWDGGDLVTQDTASQVLYRFKVSGSKATSVSSASFNGDRTKLIHQFAIAGKSVVMPYGTVGRIVRKVGMWPYPSGGAESKAVDVKHSTELVGVTVSVPRK
jgi:hypothetical protein